MSLDECPFRISGIHRSTVHHLAGRVEVCPVHCVRARLMSQRTSVTCVEPAGRTYALLLADAGRTPIAAEHWSSLAVERILIGCSCALNLASVLVSCPARSSIRSTLGRRRLCPPQLPYMSPIRLSRAQAQQTAG